jgi:hypothetical protein
MSLTNEQVKELNRLNDLFRRFEAKAVDNHLDAEELVHQFMSEEFPMVNPDRSHMQKLSDMRKELLAGKKAGPLQTVNREGDIQLSFD